MPQLTLKIDLGHILVILAMIVTWALAVGEYRRDIAYLKEFMVDSKADRAAMTVKLRELDSRAIRVETRLADHLNGSTRLDR